MTSNLSVMISCIRSSKARSSWTEPTKGLRTAEPLPRSGTVEELGGVKDAFSGDFRRLPFASSTTSGAASA